MKNLMLDKVINTGANSYKELRKARPPLGTIMPLTNWIVIAFIILNFMVALSLATTAQTIHNPIVVGIFGRYFWAGVYAFLGFHLLYARLINDWEMIRRNFVAGLITKTLWMYAILYLAYLYGWKQYLGILGLWGAVMIIQYGAVITSVPKPNPGEIKNDRSNTK